jgi:SAM-dependent methyltransferase
VFALSHIVRDESAILDFGSGSGQAAFLMSRMWPNANIVCADYSFCSLYLAKKYFVPDASHVCLDGNYLLPFESGQFSTVFSTDTLHCIDSKLSIAQEFRRVGCDKAVMILPHLHNRLASPYAKSLTPRGYRRLFQGMEIRIIPEQEVIRDYFSNDSLDLRSERDDEQLAASKQGLSIVGSADSAVFRRIDALWDRRVAGCRHPRINPAYQISGGPGNWELTRRVNEPYATTFTEFDEICLPGTYRVSAPSLDARGLLNLRQTDARQFARLARSLLVLDLPEGFISEHPVLQHGNGRRTIRAAL